MLSVLMATHNGAKTISRTLQAMSEMEAPPGGWKLVVVNNASSDDTEKRVLEWRTRLPMEYLVEPRLGKSKAMNSAFGHAQGDFIVMTDDDVLPDRNWLLEWRRVADAFPQCAVFGGAIVPEFDSHQPPSYVPEWCYGTLYGASAYRTEGEIGPENKAGVYFLGGANLGIRRSVCETGGQFDEGFLVGKSGLMGEDADFVTRLSKLGHKVGFSPKSRLRHIIHPQQTSWRWMHNRFFRDGRAKFMLMDVRFSETENRFVFKFPWRCLWSAAGSALRLTFAFGRDRSRLFKQSYALMYDLGALRQALSLSWENIQRRFGGRR